MDTTRQLRYAAALAAAILTLLPGCGRDRASAPAEGQALPNEREAEWAVLFDGESLNGWTNRGDGRWVVEDGYITTVPGTGGGFLVTTEGFEDFRLHVEFWADTTANGGVFFGVPEMGEINSTNSFEVNIFDAHDLWPTGSISELERHDDPQTAGRWSTLDVTVQSDHMMVSLDGQQTADVRAARSSAGRIALQHYLGDGVIRYRNIRLIRF